MSNERRRIVVAGGGGHARVVIEILLDGDWTVEGFTDPRVAAGEAFGSVRCLGDDSALPALRLAGVTHAIVALGDNTQRGHLADRISSMGFSLGNAIHESSRISRSVRLGQGIAVMAQVAINAGTTIGDNTIVNTGASVDHDCQIGRDVHIAPGAHISGYVTLGDRVLVGVGAVVGRGLRLKVGEDAVIGAGAVVIADIPPGITVVGNPARPLTGVGIPVKPFIPVSAPALRGNEKRYVMECLESTWISSVGSFVERFEHSFAEYCGAEHAISCCNGTMALHLSLLGIGIGPGDQVLVPSLTYVASANAVRYCGAEPVFVDCDRGTWNIDPTDVRRKIGPRVKAILPVHLYGKPAAMEELNSIAREFSLSVIEDAAEATGAKLKGRTTGKLADVAAFSFFGSKIITCGEGGMVLTDDRELARRIRQLKGQGQDFERRYWFPVIGYNYRMTNIQAAIGLAQLERVAEYLEARDEIDAWYREELVALPGIALPVREQDERRVNWLFSMVLTNASPGQRDEVMRKMFDRGVDSRPFFYPCHTLPPYEQGPGDCPNAEWLSARGLSLPTWVGLKRADVRRVVTELVAAYGGQH